jgi:hypothetical protein
MPNQPTNSTNDVVKALLDAKAVNFEAIGTVVAKYGASAVTSLDYEDVFCGTMRRYIRVYRIQEVGSEVEDLPALGSVGAQLAK